MEEKKNVANNKPTYDELLQKANEVFAANQKMQKYINELQSALEEKDFNYTSFFLSMLFKVVEHPQMYRKEFCEWCVNNIESALIAFSEQMKSQNTEDTKSNEAE